LIEAALAVDQSSIKPLFERFSNREIARALKETITKPVYLRHGNCIMVAPLSLTDAHQWLKTLPDARVIAGATDFGVALNKGKAKLTAMLSLHLIEELYDMAEENGRIRAGARVTLSRLRRFSKTRIPAFASVLNIFASPQIKNTATLVGNIANGSPIGDTLPFLMVSDGQVHVWGEEGERMIKMAEVYLGYKILALKPFEFITHASFAMPKRSHKLWLDKVSQRKDLDISTVNSAFCFDVDDALSKVNEARIAFGGVHATVMRLKKTEEYLQGKVLSQPVIERASVILQEEVAPLSDLRGTSGYRRVLADGLFRRYCDEVRGNKDASA
jgi:xanthine dehydrogenase small subunit